MNARRFEVVIVGAGGLAQVLASAWARSKRVSVTIAARRPAAAVSAARRLGGVRSAPSIEAAVARAGTVLFAVPDRAIGPLAASLARSRGSWRGTVALHAAGAYGPELLRPLAQRGAATGVLHPLAVARPGAALAGSFARIEGAPGARSRATLLAALAGLVPLRGSRLGTPAGRRAYHAAASLASNDVIALLASAHAALVGQGVSGRAALAALVALAGGALAQAERTGIAGALTGPAVRGDARTLAAQIRALRASDPAAAAAHRALSARLIELARASGRIPPREARSLRSALSNGRRRRGTV